MNRPNAEHRTAGASSTDKAEGPEPPANLALWDSRKLFGRSTEIGILHEGSLYRLKITRQGKLILNK